MVCRCNINVPYGMIPLESLVFALAEVMDSGPNNPLVAHQLKVSYICRILGRELGFKGKDLEDITIAGALHDIGIITFSDKLKVLKEDEEALSRHTTLGYHILKNFSYFANIAKPILYHHTPWNILKRETSYDTAIKANIIYFADKVEVRTRKLQNILFHVPEIIGEFRDKKEAFAPEIIDAFLKVAEKDLFWERLEYFKKETEIAFQSYTTLIPDTELKHIARLFSILIDVKSPFTRIHSKGVAYISRWLGEEFGFKDKTLDHLEIAGYLHDIGKLVVPEHILNKPARLTPEEWAVMRVHPFSTFRTLEQIPHLTTITKWAAQHHERLDGRGYPARLTAKDLSLGSRIVAVADITTAILEDRPYRPGMTPEQAKQVLQDLSGTGIDESIGKMVIENIDYAKHLIQQAQEDREHIFEEIGLTF